MTSIRELKAELEDVEQKLLEMQSAERQLKFRRQIAIDKCASSEIAEIDGLAEKLLSGENPAEVTAHGLKQLKNDADMALYNWQSAKAAISKCRKRITTINALIADIQGQRAGRAMAELQASRQAFAKQAARMAALASIAQGVTVDNELMGQLASGRRGSRGKTIFAMPLNWGALVEQAEIDWIREIES